MTQIVVISQQEALINAIDGVCKSARMRRVVLSFNAASPRAVSHGA